MSSPGAVWTKMLKLWHGLALVEIPENMIVTDVMWPHRRPEDGYPFPVHAVADYLQAQGWARLRNDSRSAAMDLAREIVAVYIAACKELVKPYPIDTPTEAPPRVL